MLVLTYCKTNTYNIKKTGEKNLFTNGNKAGMSLWQCFNSNTFISRVNMTGSGFLQEGHCPLQVRYITDSPVSCTAADKDCVSLFIDAGLVFS